jgi:hypothetical protein
MKPLFHFIAGACLAISSQTALCFGATPEGILNPRERGETVLEGVSNMNDVPWLERIASSRAEVKRLRAPEYLGMNVRDVQIAAFARLGELHTKESLAAIERIEKKAKEIKLLPDVVSLELWAYPVFHYADSEAKPIATIEAPDGTTYGVIRQAFLLGADDFFLISTKTPDDKTSWSRPKLIPGDVAPMNISKASLAFKSDGVLELTLIILKYAPYQQGKKMPPPESETRKVEIPIQQVVRDRDGDGWTDIEELRLGLDPNKKDTDGDGLADGEDPCPNFAAPSGHENDEESQIVQKAFFPTFAWSQSRFALLVGPESAKVHISGYSGPIIYVADVDKWHKEHERGWMFLDWTVKRSGDEAEVRFSDYEGSEAGSTQYILLRKIDGKWLVVQRRIGRVS